MLAICRDVTERKRGERMLTTQAEVLERIARGAPLSDTLDRLLRAVDEQGEDIKSSILLLDDSGQYLSSIAGPALPAAYSQLLQNFRIGPKVGSCGTAAFTRQPVYVRDLTTDPLWEGYSTLASPFGLRGCWSTPILDADAKVLGTLAIYTESPALPSDHHKRVIEAATHTAAICISRVRSEEALKASEANLRRAQSMAHVGSWTFDPIANQFHGSEESSKLCGWEAGVHSDRELWDLIPPEDRARTLAAWQKALAGEDYELEHRVVVRGKTRWVHARAHAERDDSGTVVRITGMSQDITDRKRLEIALRALSSAAILGSGDAFYRHLCTQLGAVFESTGSVIAELHSGPSPQWTILGSGGGDCEVSGELTRSLGKIGEQVLQTQKPFVSREIQLFPSTSPSEASDCLVIPLFDSSCQCIGLMAVIYPPERQSSNDWSPILRLFSERAAVEIERNRSLTALQTAEARFRSVIENSHDCLTLIDCDGRFSYTSPALEPMLGYTAEELIGRDASAIIAPDHLPTFESNRQQALISSGTHVSFEVLAQHRDGSSRWLRISETNRLADPSLRAIVSNWQDVSAQKAVEIARARLESQLRQSQKMEAIGTLAGGIAHDFNNILGAITGYAELALLQCDDHEGVRADLKDILKSGFRAKDLVRQILTFSRQQEPQRIPTALDGIISDSMRLLRAGVPANIDLVVSIPKNLPIVLADATQIQQVLLNLVSNAAAAIGPKSGRIEVELSEVQTGSELVERHPDFTPGPAVRLSVRDTGPGIEPAVLERIFEPFFTTKGPGQGTGLGLSVVHGIIRSHEGIIDVHSEPGQGTEFEIYLPASGLPLPSEPSVPHETEALSIPSLHKSSGTILLVDDESALLRVTAKILQLHGYEVLPASSPSEALELFQHSAHVVDLILTDFAMPGCNGVEFGRQILGLRPTIPIVLCSGHGAGMNRERALEIGFSDFLTKPIGMHRLLSVVGHLLHHVPTTGSTSPRAKP